jgi:hypothetical protein
MSVITDENALAGESNPAMYSVSGAGDLDVQGFARKTSINAGETLNFAVDGGATRIDIYRIGHYGGNNWRKVDELVNTPVEQGNGAVIADSNGAKTMAAWTNTASWAIPSGAVSGLYVGVVVNPTLGRASRIPFVVRNDARVADIVVGIPTSTWGAAYNYYHDPSNPLGGKCLYGYGLANINDRSFAVSYDRPIVSRDSIVNHWDNYDSAMIDWLEENGYDVKYVASEDLHFRPEAWNDSTIYMSVGHDEYWSQTMRDNVEAFRDAGGHCMFVTANECFWKIRYTDERTIWCYKDTMPGPGGHTAGVALDPVEWTGTFRDTRRPGGAVRESLLTGTFFRMNGISWRDPVISAATYGTHPFWRGTSVETTNLTLVDAVGFEADEIDITDDRAYSILAAAVVSIPGAYADDNGQVYSGNGSLNPWGIVMHQRYATEGVVVGFGTMAWAWMLSDYHRDGGNVKLIQCQQATVNLLKDLGVSAESLNVALDDPTPVDLSVYGMDAGDPPDPPDGGVIDPWELKGYGAAPVTAYMLSGVDLVELYPQG